jgi:hypothetical protein
MADIWRRYLADVPWQGIPGLLRAHGVSEADNPGMAAWILHTAALLRLAHASLDDTPERESILGVVPGTLSRTTIKSPRGRPKTARWAFWTAFLMHRNLRINGKPPTYDLLTGLIRILLSPRRVAPEEVRTVFVELRREVTRCATVAAQEILMTALKAGVNEKAFIQPYKDREKDLAPDSQMRPMVKDGKLNKKWLKTVIETRRAILHRVRKDGPLGGELPIISIEHSANIGSWAFGGLSRPGGTVHLGKATEVPVPGIPSEGGTIGISFSRNFLNGEPFASRLYAVPAWFIAWRSLFVPVPTKSE